MHARNITAVRYCSWLIQSVSFFVKAVTFL